MPLYTHDKKKILDLCIPVNGTNKKISSLYTLVNGNLVKIFSSSTSGKTKQANDYIEIPPVVAGIQSGYYSTTEFQINPVATKQQYVLVATDEVIYTGDIIKVEFSTSYTENHSESGLSILAMQDYNIGTDNVIMYDGLDSIWADSDTSLSHNHVIQSFTAPSEFNGNFLGWKLMVKTDDNTDYNNGTTVNVKIHNIYVNGIKLYLPNSSTIINI